nr:MAG TPA: hypothetical protein [Caudoviricetes sp.]
MIICTNHYSKEEHINSWKYRNRIIYTLISVLAVFVAIILIKKTIDISNSSTLIMAFEEKSKYFYVIMNIIGFLAIGSSNIIKNRLSYIRAMSINNSDIDRFFKAIKITYLDKLVVFCIYLAIYYVIGFILIIVNMYLDNALI